MACLLTPNPRQKHIDRSGIIMVAKYQKLHRYFQRNFSSNKATLTLRTVFATKSILVFWEDEVFLRLFRIQTQYHCHVVAPRLHQTGLPDRQKWAILHLLDEVVTFLCNCSRGGVRGRPISRFSRVSGKGGSE